MEPELIKELGDRTLAAIKDHVARALAPRDSRIAELATRQESSDQRIADLETRLRAVEGKR